MKVTAFVVRLHSFDTCAYKLLSCTPIAYSYVAFIYLHTLKKRDAIIFCDCIIFFNNFELVLTEVKP